MSAPQTADLEDVQGNILASYALEHVRYLFLRVADAARARAFLVDLKPRITRAAPRSEAKPDTAHNIAFSFTGLAALGVPSAALTSFPKEFRVGMAARAAVLGDVGASAPEAWERPLGTPSVHVLVIVHGLTGALRDTAAAELRGAIIASGGFEVLYEQDGDALEGEQRGHEHFGYRDAISQPAIKGSPEPHLPGHGYPVEGSGGRTWRPIALGTLLLGYPDEHESHVAVPEPVELRMNGTYLVFRKLRQEVTAFRGYLRARAEAVGGDSELLAAKLMGRWRSGAPLALSPHADAPALAADPARNNDFAYGDDPEGLRCPRQAHIRRANPRDDLQRHAYMGRPMGVTSGNRLVRRGIPYGPWLSADEDDGQERGLLFVALNANLSDQFEFVQGEWLNSGNTTGGLSRDRDPIMGQGAAATFRIPEAQGGGVTLRGLPDFVTVRGGEYFFMPGLAALDFITLASARDARRAPPPSFLDAFDAIARAPGQSPQETAQKQARHAVFALENLPVLTAELRARRPILTTAIATYVTKYADVLEVLANDGPFSSRHLGDKMLASTGRFMLGMDSSAQYDQDLALAKLAVRRSDEARVRAAAAEIADGFLRTIAARGGRIDVVQDFGNRVPIRVMGEYFGVPGPADDITAEWFQTISLYMFNFWALDPSFKQAGVRAGMKIQAYIDELIATRRRLAAKGRGQRDDVIGRLIQLQSSAPDFDDVAMRSMLAGLFSGSIVATMATFTNIVDRLMTLKDEQPDDFEDLLATARAGNEERLRAYWTEAARFEANPAWIERVLTEDYVLARGTKRQVTLSKGTVVAAFLSSAMFDEEAIPDAQKFRIGRPDRHNLLFGRHHHVCIGRGFAEVMLTEMLRALLRLRGLRRAPGAEGRPRRGPPRTIPFSYWTQHLILEFER